MFRPADNNVAQYINGLTKVPYATLREMIVLHGGVLVPYMDRKSLVTHILANNLTPQKRVEFRNYKVVTEAFITVSCESGVLQDWRDFALLSPDHHLQQSTTSFSSEVDGGGASHGVAGELPTGTAIKQQTLLGMRQAKPALSKTKSLAKKAKEDNLYDNSPNLPRNPTHKAATFLANEAWRHQHTATGDDFISSYYQQSRLHHLSQWKTELPAMVLQLTSELDALGKLPSLVKKSLVEAANNSTSTKKPPNHLKGTPADGRTIFHVDFDCFFCTVGLIDRPDLKGLPVAVCHSRGGGANDREGSTSEIASCTYEARAFGVKAGMRFGLCFSFSA